MLHAHSVKSVLDLTCGTGSQLFYLAKQGYEVFGIDFNYKMLAIAQRKAKHQNLLFPLQQDDMRTAKIGSFDAVLTISNAIGHLTKEDFELALQNINSNVKPNGLYIFDIFNLDYLLHDDNITKLTIDWQKKSGEVTAREIQYSTILPSGVLASYDIYHEQVGLNKPKITTAFQTLQVYNVTQLKDMLNRNGFKVIQQSAIDGSIFKPQETERILTVAQRY